jgi:hypothetical protein
VAHPHGLRCIARPCRFSGADESKHDPVPDATRVKVRALEEGEPDSREFPPLPRRRFMNRLITLAAALSLVVLASGLSAPAASAQEKTKTQIYGFVMTDMRYDSEAINSEWFDVLRPSKLAAYKNEFGEEGNIAFSARQSRLGVKSFIPTDMGELKTTFEFELFGTGEDAGQTTFRLRHAYGELGKFGAGQTWSPFMDIDVFPNSIEYWGPTGMVFFRNIQFRYMPIQGDTRLTFALERPGASADQGEYDDRIEVQNVVGRFPLPDLSAEYRIGRPWGYVELAGIVRYMEWNDTNPASPDLSGDALGWGLNLSSNLKFGGNSTLRLQAVYGEGIQNYMNDAPADLGIQNNPGNVAQPFEGVTLPVLGLVAFLDHTWNSKWTSTIGYSMCDIDNSNGQRYDAYSKGDYALVNVLYSPVPNLMLGPELQWDKRTNFEAAPDDDLGPGNTGYRDVDNMAFQFSAKYSFSSMFGGE